MEHQIPGNDYKEIISGLLREKYNFQGIICTDWATITDLKPLGIIFKPASAHGVEHLNTDQRLKKLFNAGIDMIGGESLSSSGSFIGISFSSITLGTSFS